MKKRYSKKTVSQLNRSVQRETKHYTKLHKSRKFNKEDTGIPPKAFIHSNKDKMKLSFNSMTYVLPLIPYGGRRCVLTID